jgi:DNA-directed RNA polymerase sigma subunit (sigma70/sigma32)
MSDGNNPMKLGRRVRDRAIYEASKLEGMSNADLGELFGMTSERARQIVKREAQTKLKAKAKAKLSRS